LHFERSRNAHAGPAAGFGDDAVAARVSQKIAIFSPVQPSWRTAIKVAL
jgi:hypothetical protein